MQRLVEQQPPFKTYTNLDYTRGFNDALSRYSRGESIINQFLGIGAGGYNNRDTSPKTTFARLKLPYDKHYDGDPFAEPYAGDYLLNVIDIDMPRPRHARKLTSFVQRVRLGLTAIAGEGYSTTKPQDFHVNDEGVLFSGGGLSLWLYPNVEIGYVPVNHEGTEPPTASNVAVLAPTPTLPSLEAGAELLQVR